MNKNDLIFYDDEEQKKMEEAYLLSVERSNLVHNRDDYDVIKLHEDIISIYNCYFYLTGYIKDHLDEDINSLVNYLNDLSIKCLNRINHFNYDFYLPILYKEEKVLNTKESKIEEMKRWHYVTHNKNGMLKKLYDLLIIFSDKDTLKNYIKNNY